MEEELRLSEEIVRMEGGGWNWNFARVVLIEQCDRHAVVLVDGNGDGTELELEYWSHGETGRWTCLSSAGHGALSSLERADTWTTGTHVVALGRAVPGVNVRLSYRGDTHTRQANDFGVWGFISPSDPEFPEKLPVVFA